MFAELTLKHQLRIFVVKRLSIKVGLDIEGKATHKMTQFKRVADCTSLFYILSTTQKLSLSRKMRRYLFLGDNLQMVGH